MFGKEEAVSEARIATLVVYVNGFRLFVNIFYLCLPRFTVLPYSIGFTARASLRVHFSVERGESVFPIHEGACFGAQTLIR